MTNDLDIARAALRDGLWDVARTHALKLKDDTAKLIVLETYAREENWKGLLAAYDAMGYPSGDGFAYYRAAALFKEGSVETASNLLANTVVTNGDFAHPVARLRAELALSRHDSGAALSILEKEGGEDVETKMMVASIRVAAGALAESKRLWRDVLANTNAPERARAMAAVGLQDVKALRDFLAKTQSEELRRFVALKLGVLFVSDKTTFAEGEKLILKVVHDKPDAEGAREAFLALAEARITRGEFAEAEKTYSEALQIWSDAVKDASLHEGRGWALLKLGLNDKAVDEFRTAETLLTDPERKAAAAVKMADALTALGKEDDAADVYRRVRVDYSNTVAAAHVVRIIGFQEREADGKELYHNFKFDEARKAFAALAKENPSRRDSLTFYEVLCAYGAGDDEAADRLARALVNGAEDKTVQAEATLWLAKFSFNRCRWREAESLFLRFAQCAPKAAETPRALALAARAALSGNDFPAAVTNAALLVARYPESPACAAGMLTQGEALIELGRFDEAVLVFDRAALIKGATDANRLAFRILRADALFAMGADNPARYTAALDAYKAIRSGETLSPNVEISMAFKMAKTLEKLKRLDEAMDIYYSQVVLAYRTGRLAGTCYDDSVRVAFSRAAFRLADEYESRGRIHQAVHVLDLVRTSDVPAASEAANRIEKLTKKGLSL